MVRRQNLDISDGHAARRLAELRQARGLTKAELAEAAGVTYRTVHDLESGRRPRVQEKTLIVLADVLGTSLQDLLAASPAEPDDEPPAPTPWYRRRRTRHAPLALGAVLLAIVLGFEATKSQLVPVYTPNGTVIRAEVPGLGLAAWSREYDSRISFVEPSPWTDDLWLAGFGSNARDGGRLRALDRRTGEVRWEVFPEMAELRAAYGDSILDDAYFSVGDMVPADLDGDGTPEVVLRINHGMWFPMAVVAIDDEGTVLGQYEHPGHLLHFTAGDVDDDGRDEVFLTGYVNCDAHEGGAAVLLDLEGLSGGLPSHDASTPRVIPTDTAPARLLVRNYPSAIMNQFDAANRLGGYSPRIVRDSDGRVALTLLVGSHASSGTGTDVFLRLTPELRVASIGITDAFHRLIVSSWPDSLLPGPTDPEWLREWTRSFVRYERGRLATEVLEGP
jgi:transcriptional regulator with XRE-family HTH domain